MEKIVQKRESGISRIIGVGESAEPELLDYFKRQFEKNPKYSGEQEHTPELDNLIAEINQKMKEFLARYGVESLDIPAGSIHILDKSKLTPQQLAQYKERYEKIGAVYLLDKQQIWIFKNYQTGQKLHFVKNLVHEMMHLNAFGSAQKVTSGGIGLMKGEESIHLKPRRVGFEVDSAKTGKMFFLDVNEAITEELIIRFDKDYYSQFQDLKNEYEEREEARAAVSKRSGKSKSEMDRGIANLEHRPVDAQGGHEVILRPYSYSRERGALNKLILDLYEKNKIEFRSPEDVFSIFAKAALTGRLSPIARLIEKTYGKGSFRELGEKTQKLRRNP